MSDDDQRPPPIRGTIPITWGTGREIDPKTGEKRFKHRIDTKAQVIREPSLQDIAVFSDQQAKTCGSCKHFRPPTKDRPEVSGFIARAIHEAQWKLGYLGHSPENLSRCRENADTLVGVNSKACPNYKAGNGGLR